MHGWYDAPEIEFPKWREAIVRSQLEIQKYGFEANIIENHDEPRGASRFFACVCPESCRSQNVGNCKCSSQRNSFYISGSGNRHEKCGMGLHGEFDDINTKDQYQVAVRAGLSEREALEICGKMSRDNARTPVQWSGAENAGFTTERHG